MLIKTHIYFPFDFHVVYLDSNFMLYVYPWSSKQNTLTLTLTQFISDNNNENYVTILHKQEKKEEIIMTIIILIIIIIIINIKVN